MNISTCALVKRGLFVWSEKAPIASRNVVVLYKHSGLVGKSTNRKSDACDTIKSQNGEGRMHEFDGQRNKRKTQEEGDINQKNNECCDCKEGCILGENIYCSIDGRFHPLRGKITCGKFIPVSSITVSNW